MISLSKIPLRCVGPSSSAAVRRRHLVGVALVVWGVCAAVRRWATAALAAGVARYAVMLGYSAAQSAQAPVFEDLTACPRGRAVITSTRSCYETGICLASGARDFRGTGQSGHGRGTNDV